MLFMGQGQGLCVGRNLGTEMGEKWLWQKRGLPLARGGEASAAGLKRALLLPSGNENRNPENLNDLESSGLPGLLSIAFAKGGQHGQTSKAE